MPPIDLTNMSCHITVDRKARLSQIQAIGWGSPIASVEIYREGRIAYKTLTSTGIIIIRSSDNMIITAYIAEVHQAISLFRSCYGRVRLPQDIYDKITLNNIMFPTA